MCIVYGLVIWGITLSPLLVLTISFGESFRIFEVVASFAIRHAIHNFAVFMLTVNSEVWDRKIIHESARPIERPVHTARCERAPTDCVYRSFCMALAVVTSSAQ